MTNPSSDVNKRKRILGSDIPRMPSAMREDQNTLQPTYNDAKGISKGTLSHLKIHNDCYLRVH